MTPLAGQMVEQVESRGKWLLIHFSGGGTLATHHADERELAHLPAGRAMAAAARGYAHCA